MGEPKEPDGTELILEAGRAIRPYLTTLLGTDADRVDANLAELLARADRSAVASAIEDVLERDAATRQWVSAFWRIGGMPPEVVVAVYPDLDPRAAERQVRATVLGGGGLPGDPVAALPGKRYACPRGDFAWYRLDAAEEVPECRTHRLRLVQAPKAAD